MHSILKAVDRILDTRPDTLDFRDKLYEATLVEVPARIDLEEYMKWNIPILDQGREGACTGFALATVAHYLLTKRYGLKNLTQVSPWMLYAMAKRYDEWPGEDYEGSSARGAMKAWHKHGVCSDRIWTHRSGKVKRDLNDSQASDAAQRPLGAYYRVNHKDLVAMHSAIAEVGVLYATGLVHEGWEQIGSDGVIPLKKTIRGGHAFALVGYDERGFWFQNSWGNSWGKNGFALITYDDWLINGTDVWVARLGVPVILNNPIPRQPKQLSGLQKTSAYIYQDLRPHLISIGADGALSDNGTYASSSEALQRMLIEDFPRITKSWQKKRLCLFAPGGLQSKDQVVEALTDLRQIFLNQEIYPLAFLWNTEYGATLTQILENCLKQRRPEGTVEENQDFMLDRLDDALEPLVRPEGSLQWSILKTKALQAAKVYNGAIRLTLEFINQLQKQEPNLEIHLIGHSVGSLLLEPLVQLLTTQGLIGGSLLAGDVGYGQAIASCTLWAPASTLSAFHQSYGQAIANDKIGKFTLFTLTDDAEKNDHCANLYHRSLLYLIAHSLEEKPRIPFSPTHAQGTAIAGMETFIRQDEQLQDSIASGKVDWILAPNTGSQGDRFHCSARTHQGFAQDRATLKATLARILREPEPEESQESD
ncbi:C1 family peptidase [Roseofilum sp. BLCC_M91]|uniref:C1 family peptidase n=1 Tax=Roseofilum halophilum BLCC-M91 TaxID=3022259 RepID=A0ABT7BMP0_9CYAN|nr:C1 family peptidase [Roseofilum halophilum]MDJ1180451.1 C1 family peptidase [Roseofilum halophilum BLCC-M91]